MEIIVHSWRVETWATGEASAIPLLLQRSAFRIYLVMSNILCSSYNLISTIYTYNRGCSTSSLQVRVSYGTSSDMLCCQSSEDKQQYMLLGPVHILGNGQLGIIGRIVAFLSVIPNHGRSHNVHQGAIHPECHPNCGAIFGVIVA